MGAKGRGLWLGAIISLFVNKSGYYGRRSIIIRLGIAGEEIYRGN